MPRERLGLYQSPTDHGQGLLRTNLPQRDAALVQAFDVVLEHIRREKETVTREHSSSPQRISRVRDLQRRAQYAMDQIRDARFQGIGPLE